jgi:two-component system response regulator MprA
LGSVACRKHGGVTYGTIAICVADDALRHTLCNAFARIGLAVEPFAQAAAAMRGLTTLTPAVLVLDIALPDADGRDVCHALRANGIDVPVLFLGAAGTVAERVSSFHAGGDDYLAKPFDTAELLVRASAVARRRTRGSSVRAPAEPAFDPVNLAVTVEGHTANLAPSEYRLLAALAARRGEVLPRGDLIAAAWPAERSGSDATLDASIARLREKLQGIAASATIDAALGVGFSLH